MLKDKVFIFIASESLILYIDDMVVKCMWGGAQWFTRVIPALWEASLGGVSGRIVQGHEFETSLDNIARLCVSIIRKRKRKRHNRVQRINVCH